MAKKFRFHGKTQEVIMEIDYYKKLNKEEKQWLNEFNDGVLNNNHRKYPMFTEHPEYQSRIKKEIYDSVNARNRCTTSELGLRKQLDSLDYLSGTKEEAFISNILFKTMTKKESEQMLINFGVKSFEESCTSLMTETAISIGNESVNNEFVLLNFYLTINALIKEELREQRKEKKRLKELEA